MSIVSYSSQIDNLGKRIMHVNFFSIGLVVVVSFKLLPYLLLLFHFLLLADRIFSRSFGSICYVDVEQYLFMCVVAVFFE